jgi:hypothetical protein
MIVLGGCALACLRWFEMPARAVIRRWFEGKMRVVIIVAADRRQNVTIERDAVGYRSA